jgi:hypothetical protein
MPSIPYRMTFLDDEAVRVAAEVTQRRGGRLMSRVRRGYLISQRHRELVIMLCGSGAGARTDDAGRVL